ncbi:MAG: diphosphate--fructose-6-phosphate 1-phosphotransferase [Sporolactobacillus sp.]|jgi:6-phosphofructokinase 1|nr:diphosphate--fructose-6-phosphate 1-phosphotransferase [Sporolactobacillus sp.]
MSKNNLIIIHGGAPTVTLNSSLYGVITECKQYEDSIGHVWGARNGVEGVLSNDWIELDRKTDEEIDALLTSPGTAIGSSRYPLNKDGYLKMLDHFGDNNIRYVLLSGGNGTMATCGYLSRLCKEKNNGIKVMGIPKTIDNDIDVIDHSPGYLSAAKYMIHTTREIIADVRSLPIHVCIIEAMGRNAGWITAASSLSANNDDLVPDLIYMPEKSFDEDRFLMNVKEIYARKGYAVVVASEGLRNNTGKPIVPEIYRQGRSVYYGDVGNYLANLVIQKLHIKARDEKPGIAGRSSIYLQSAIDRKEAVAVGKRAVREIMAGQTGKMVGIFRSIVNHKYSPIYKLVDINKVMLTESKLPDEFISPENNYVTEKFKNWLRPMMEIVDYFPIVNFN